MQLFSRNKAIVALSLGALALGACGDDVTVPVAPAAPITLSITPPSANMNIGEAVNFAVQISGGTGAATLASCTSSSATVATATVSGSSCRVTAVGAGNATITAAASTGQSAAASVSVAAPAAAISGLQVSPSAASVQVNQTVTIVPTVNKGAAAVAVAYTYASSTASVATVSAAGVVTAVGPGVATITVTATGTGTGFTSTTLTSAAAITVTALPTGMTSLNVSPATLALAAGSTAQVVANAQQPSGAAAATITYGTTAPAVATVSSMGLITAVGAGSAVITVTASSAANANFAAATLSGTVAVTVSPAAQISISGITYTYNQYNVDVNDVSGQIQVNTVLATNGQLVTAVSAWVCRVGETVPECATRSGSPAAQQSFGTGGAASGAVSLAINTADFTVAPDFSSASAKYNNGQNVIVATVSTAAGLNSANSNLAILNFTNQDGFAARHVAPTTTATTSGGVAYFGGPGAAGRGSMSVVPVTYTVGRTIKAATVGMPTSVVVNASCAGPISFTSAATPWTFTYGTSLGTATGANATNIVCTGAVATLDVTPVVSASTYSDNTGGPNATGAVENGFFSNTFKTVSSSTTPVAAPASIRVDYLAPSGGAIAIPANGWLNGSANLTGAGTGNILTLATDANVGLTTSATVRYVRATSGCSAPTDTTTITAATASNDLAECVGNNSNTVYTAHYYPVDRLGNAGLRVASSTSFGVDRTAPLVRYSAGIAADRSINPAEANAFQVEALDERSGLTSAATASFTRTLRRSSSLSLSGWAAASNNFCNDAPAATGSLGFGALFISAPNCAYAATAAYAGTTTDGYSIAPAIAYAGLAGDGYFTYRARVLDEAGNPAVVARQAILRSTTTPTVTAAVMIAPITSTYTGPFTGTFQDQVETKGTGLRVKYGAVELAYPMSLTSAVAFDDVITRDSLYSGTTPFASGVRLYTDLEQTTVGNAPGGTLFQLSASGHYAQNFGGVGASSFANFLTGSITFDAATWTTKSATLARFYVTSDAASYNSPVGGLKAQVVGPANTFNSPFSRVDFYRLMAVSGQWEYVGSVDATATPCISVSQTCGVYIGENTSTTERVITYVLRAPGTGAESTDAISLAAGNYVAIGTTGTSGRGLLTQGSADLTPPPPASRR